LAQAVIAVAVIDIIAAITLGVMLVLPSGHGEPRAQAPTAPRTALTTRRIPAPATSRPVTPATRPAAPTSTTTRPAAAASTTARQPLPIGAPVVLAISPQAGAAGQVVTIHGKGFFSRDGRITVTFGSVAAPVACPAQTACHTTVPARPPGASRTVWVILRTQSGASNRVAFTYSRG